MPRMLCFPLSRCSGRSIWSPSRDPRALAASAPVGLLAAVGAGAWKTIDEACDQAIRIAETIVPNDKAVKVLSSHYKKYQSILMKRRIKIYKTK